MEMIMSKNIYFAASMLALLVFVLVACGGGPAANADPVIESSQPGKANSSDPTTDVEPAQSPTNLAVGNPAAPEEPTAEVVDTESHPIDETRSGKAGQGITVGEEEIDSAAGNSVVETGHTVEDAVDTASPPPGQDQAVANAGQPVPFTATTGLETFSSYRMSFESQFDGSQRGKPVSGTINGRLEAIKNPTAQHWQINLDGDSLDQLVPIKSVELYTFQDTIYIQNPQDGTWLGMPKFLVDSLLPQEMYSPEDSIDLPQTAVLQPGVETVNGIEVRRYSFGPDDLVEEGSDFESVDGTIWVAIDGDYVVRYEAEVTGQFGDFAAGGVELLDQGTVIMMYELADVNGSFSIEPPAATSVNLTDLLFN
jgi:hypothetical protein